MSVQFWTRVAAVASALAAGRAGVASAQDSLTAQIQVTLSPDSTVTGSRSVMVTTVHLLDDPRWLGTLRSGFPIRLHYSVQLWRSVQGWFDGFSQAGAWDVLVQHEPLMDQYTVTRITGAVRRENRYATIETLASALGLSYLLAVRPSDPGEYYYVVTLQITALSDSDMEDLKQFLEGDFNSTAEGKEDLGTAVGRGAKRLVLRLAGLPSVEVTGRTARFQVRSAK